MEVRCGARVMGRRAHGRGGASVVAGRGCAQDPSLSLKKKGLKPTSPTHRGQVPQAQRLDGHAGEAVEEGAGEALAAAPLAQRVLRRKHAERRGARKHLRRGGE